jgi:hypothetical protein
VRETAVPPSFDYRQYNQPATRSIFWGPTCFFTASLGIANAQKTNEPRPPAIKLLSWGPIYVSVYQHSNEWRRA